MSAKTPHVHFEIDLAGFCKAAIPMSGLRFIVSIGGEDRDEPSTQREGKR